MMGHLRPFPNLGGGDRVSSGGMVRGGQAAAGGHGTNPQPNTVLYFRKSEYVAANTAYADIIQKGLADEMVWITSLVVTVAGASPTAEVHVTITEGSTGKVVWREVIGPNAIIGSRVGWVRDERPFSLPVGVDYYLSVTAPGASCRLVINTDGFRSA